MKARFGSGRIFTTTPEGGKVELGRFPDAKATFAPAPITAQIRDALARAIERDKAKGGDGLRDTREVADAVGISTSRARRNLYAMAEAGIVDEYEGDGSALLWRLRTPRAYRCSISATGEAHDVESFVAALAWIQERVGPQELGPQEVEPGLWVGGEGEGEYAIEAEPAE